MNHVLRMKHWQVFILVGFFFIDIIVVLPMVLILKLPFDLFLAGIIFWLVSYIGYLLLIGLGLYEKTHLTKGLDYNVFIFATGYSLVYSIFFGLMIANVFSTPTKRIDIAVLIPFHLASMLANLNAFRFDAKYLVAVEINAKPGLSKYIVELILFWFLPIGIWMLQPRINKIAAKQ